MSSYASGTEVPVDRSRAEIEKILGRYEATTFMYGTNQLGAMIAFEAHGRRVRMMVPIPDRKKFEVSDGGRVRTESQIESAYQQEHRRRWRALCLVVKAKFEATQSGVATFEQEFLPYIVIPGTKGQTASEWLLPQIEQAYETNKLPPLLALGSGSK